MAPVPPAITREEGCGDTANVPTRVFRARSHVLKLHATGRKVPSLQLPPFAEEKKKKRSASKPGKHPFIQFARDMAGHPREPPARSIPPSPARPPRPKGNEVAKVIVLVFD